MYFTFFSNVDLADPNKLLYSSEADELNLRRLKHDLRNINNADNSGSGGGGGSGADDDAIPYKPLFMRANDEQFKDKKKFCCFHCTKKVNFFF